MHPLIVPKVPFPLWPSKERAVKKPSPRSNLWIGRASGTFFLSEYDALRQRSAVPSLRLRTDRKENRHTARLFPRAGLNFWIWPLLLFQPLIGLSASLLSRRRRTFRMDPSYPPPFSAPRRPISQLCRSDCNRSVRRPPARLSSRTPDCIALRVFLIRPSSVRSSVRFPFHLAAANGRMGELS